MDEKQGVIKQILIENGFTLGLLNKFITIAKTDRNNTFYGKNLDKVLDIRCQLLENNITIKEIEQLFESKDYTKKVIA